MRISEVELVGFKSFVDKTRFQFNDKITCVVGPNGCGKSNIVDAIRWVMGEMSAKSLRGSAMEDVIFNGTNTRKQLSMAQVSLIFSTDDGVVPVGFEGFQQIEITRRLYRSGESEYLVNKQTARLKDIYEILMDTGLGAKAYSIVEQGQIALVLSSKPEERRALIEEAAGITKFKVKKDEALRKMERTRADLDRVQDVVAEIKRQMNSLSRQAGKARRYKEFKGELREVDLELASQDYNRLTDREKSLAAEITRLEERKSKTEADMTTSENELQTKRLELAKVQTAVEDIRQELAAINDEIRLAENDRNVLARDVQNETARAKSYEEEIARSHERIARLTESAEIEQRDSAELLAKADDKSKQIEALNSQLQQARATLSLKREGEDKVRGRQVELVAKIAQLESQVNGWTARKNEIDERIDALAHKSAQTQERIIGMGDRTEALRQQHADLLTRQEDAKKRLSEKTATLGSLKEQMHQQREVFEQSKQQYQEVAVRLNSLAEMRRNMEGYREGVKRILKTADDSEENSTLQGVIDSFDKLVKVPKKYESAFEAVLGEKLQSVVVRDLESGIDAVDFLKTEKGGRGSFVPVQPKRHEYTNYPQATLQACDGPLLNKIEYDNEYADVVKHMLDGVLVVDNLENAVHLHKKNGYKGAFVSLDGEIVDPHGAITGGSGEALSSGILQMKREIDELTETAELLKQDYETARDRYEKSEGMSVMLDREIRTLTQETDRISLEIRETESEVQRSTNEGVLLEETIQELQEQIDKLRDAKEQGARQVKLNQEELAVFSTEIKQVQSSLTQSEDGTKSLSEQIDELTSEVTALSAEMTSNRERGAAAKQRSNAARQAVVENQEQIERRRDLIERCSKTAEACKEKIKVVEEKIQVLIGKAQEKRKEETAAMENHEGFAEGVRLQEGAIKALRKDFEAISAQIAAQNTSSIELKLKKENLADRVLEKYGLDIEDVLGDYGKSELDRESLAARQKELSDKIRAIGEVNLTAIEEHDEAKKRYDFYIEQQDDLLKSIDNLRQAINRINKESRERFIRTFEAVSAKFSEVLPMLFGGGEAKLSLTESDDILDAGVEVHVRPPGKKLKNMTLLSGGEKALTAIGLIFAIFLIKPSPFCLLDEVDAPLDDVNVDRFNDMIEAMSGHSQIIVITHNKRTMEKADSLYGITMEEKGVSKVVTVRMVD